jgi:release factor glutamine methyltransferase
MTLTEQLRNATQQLKNKKILSAALDAEVLLCFILKKTKEFVYAHPETELTANQIRRFGKLIAEREKGIPIAYLTGQKNFYGLYFAVNKKVLIPRPETEIMVETAIKEIRKNETVADIGTGSGCIAITIAQNSKAKKIFAVDPSAGALTVAKMNAKNNGVAKKIGFKRGSLLQPLKKEKINILLANLPYLNEKETSNLIAEPRSALFGGKTGAELYERLIEQVSELKHTPRLMLFEIGETQATPLTEHIKSFFPKAIITVIKDLCGFNRFLKIQL